MADLITRLLLDDKQFNRNLQRSRRQSKQFDDGIKKLRSGMMAFAGTLGLAMGASEAFNTAIRSSQTTSDAFDKTIAQAKGGVEYFFQSIAQGNFSNFVTGLDDAIRRAGNLVVVLDELGDRIAGWDDKSSEITLEIAENRAIIQDEATSTEERERLLSRQRVLIGELERTADIVNKTQEETIRQTIGSIANLDNITTEEVTKYLQETSLGINKELDEYAKKFNELKRQSQEVTVTQTISGDQITVAEQETQEAKNAKEKLRVLKEQNEELHRQHQINELVMDMERTGVVASRQQLRQRGVMISGMRRQLSRDQRRNYDTEGGGGGSRAEQEAIIEGSIRAIDAKIKDANEKLLDATTTQARREFANLIEDLERQKVAIEVSYTASIDNVSTKVDVEGAKLPTIPSSIMGQGSFEAPISSMDIYMDALTLARKKNEEFTVSAHAMGDALHSIAGATEGSASEWLSWGANVLGAVGAAIPAITALTTTQAASATTAAADAGAKAASSVAGIPFVGPMLAVGAVASIVAALASLPKFEHGGIVGGSSFSGDKMLARVNSGEMILNSGQQSNLFNMINSGGGSSGGGEVIGRVLGKDILFIMNQQLKRQGRI